MKKKIIILLVVVVAVLLLDQVTKIYVHSNFAITESVKVVDGLFNFTYVRNPGAAFGVFRNSSEMFRKLFFFSITPIAILFLLNMIRTTPEKETLQIVAMSSIVGGAIGNYIDRIRFSYVIDFLDFYIGSWHYPAFNVADMAIVCGVAALLGCIYLEGQQAQKV